VDNDRNIFNSLKSSNLEKAPSSTVIFIRPSSLTKRHNYEFFVPTAEVALQLSTAALAASNQGQQRFFSHMSSYPFTRSAAGWIFENFMHTRLTDKIGHVRALDVNYKEHDIPIVTSIITGPVDALKSAPASFYWRPGESKFPGIDAVARDQEDIWAFPVHHWSPTTIDDRRAGESRPSYRNPRVELASRYRWIGDVSGPVSSGTASRDSLKDRRLGKREDVRLRIDVARQGGPSDRFDVLGACLRARHDEMKAHGSPGTTRPGRAHARMSDVCQIDHIVAAFMRLLGAQCTHRLPAALSEGV
jgi:hypothetical protein